MDIPGFCSIQVFYQAVLHHLDAVPKPKNLGKKRDDASNIPRKESYIANLAFFKHDQALFSLITWISVNLPTASAPNPDLPGKLSSNVVEKTLVCEMTYFFDQNKLTDEQSPITFPN